MGGRRGEGGRGKKGWGRRDGEGGMEEGGGGRDKDGERGRDRVQCCVMVLPWRAGSPEIVAYCASSVFPVSMVSISVEWEVVFLTFS